mgnify:CR=1 FL=1
MNKSLSGIFRAGQVLPVVVLLLLSSYRTPERFHDRLSSAAIAIIDPSIQYDPSYRQIGYPGGDVPPGTGVCTDVVIRAYRKLGIDLQVEVHNDMLVNFHVYPHIFGLNRTDSNVDHRRVPNLMVFFKRKGESLPCTRNIVDYHPGDLVCWNLYGGVNHIGIVVNKMSADGQRYLVVHNIGSGQVMEDVLFNYKIIGHYSYPRPD